MGGGKIRELVACCTGMARFLEAKYEIFFGYIASARWPPGVKHPISVGGNCTVTYDTKSCRGDAGTLREPDFYPPARALGISRVSTVGAPQRTWILGIVVRFSLCPPCSTRTTPTPKN